MNAVCAVGEGLFELGLDLGVGGVRAGYGGDAPNTAVMAARMGAAALICGRVGGDALGRMLLRFWMECGVDVSAIQVDPDAPTGIYVNETTSTGHRFDYHRRCSAGSRLTVSDIPARLVSAGDVLHFTGISVSVSPSSADACAAAVKQASAAGATISYSVNYRPALRGDPDVVSQFASDADIIFASAEDLELLGLNPDTLRGHCRELVLTNGAHGASVEVGRNVDTVAPPCVQIVDCAGAGDALAGAYLACRIAGQEPGEALIAGVVAAALSCGAYGAAASYPKRTEVEATVRASAART